MKINKKLLILFFSCLLYSNTYANNKLELINNEMSIESEFTLLLLVEKDCWQEADNFTEGMSVIYKNLNDESSHDLWVWFYEACEL